MPIIMCYVEPVRTMKHLTCIDDISTQEMLDLFEHATRLSNEPIPQLRTRHESRIVATLFFEPSTRTRLSFESAALRLGARTLGFSDPSASSAIKGESLIDAIRTVQNCSDLIVLRHPGEGAATLAAKVASVPIINAGDGGHEHPTQTLLDLYTIHTRFSGDIAGRKIGFLGDLRHGRTVHSLALAAGRFGAELTFIAPHELQMPQHLLRRLESHARARQASQIDAVISELDVLYVTRVQRERMDEQLLSRIGPAQLITPQLLEKARPNLLLMHPLPRVDEIAPEVDQDPRAHYFQQVANGVLMRMALLDAIFSAQPQAQLGAMQQLPQYDDPPWTSRGDDQPCSNVKCVTNTERGIKPRWVSQGNLKRCEYCGYEG